MDAKNAKKPAAEMEVEVIYTGLGDPKVHRAGCGHVKRTKGRDGSSETFVAADMEAVGERVYDDMIEEGSETVDGAVIALEWAPCTKQLTHRKEPATTAALHGEDPSGGEVVVHLSARVAAFMATEVVDAALAGALASPRLERCGRGYTAFVTTSRERAEALLGQMKELLFALESGARTKGRKGGMNFQPEAVIKGIEHITADLTTD